MYSAEGSSAVIEPNPVPPGLQIAEAAGPASLNLDASVWDRRRVESVEREATGRKARAGPARSILPRSFYTTHRQVNGGVGFPPDTPTAVRNARHMQPIERARADDVTPALHTTLEGTQQCGPTILLVHGFAGSARAWDPLMASLTAAHPIVRVDLVGHGLSPKPMRGYSMPDQVEAICRSLDRLAVASVVAVGHSGGGDVVVEMTWTTAGTTVAARPIRADHPQSHLHPGRPARPPGHRDRGLPCRTPNGNGVRAGQHLSAAGRPRAIKCAEMLAIDVFRRAAGCAADRAGVAACGGGILGTSLRRPVIVLAGSHGRRNTLD